MNKIRLSFLFGLYLAVAISTEGYSEAKLSVAFSERKPFLTFNPDGSIRGVDVSILNNFARKFNLNIEYQFVNTSLNYILSSEEKLTNFAKRNILRYEGKRWYNIERL